MKIAAQKSRFALPVAIAAAFHAFLLFGFTPNHPVPKSKSKPDLRPDWKQPPIEVVLETPKTDEAEEPSGKPSALPPMLPDPPTTDDAMKDHIVIDREPPVPNPEARTGLTNVPNFNPFDRIGNETGPEIVPMSHLDNAPRERFRAKPEYPFALRSRGISGEVWVEFVVDPSGSVVSANVIHSTNPDFEASTLRAVMKWRFEPGKHKGRPVSFRMAVPIRFEIND